MNKEMVEILEMKEELNSLKLSTQEEIEKLSKKVKESKNESKKLIESKFEEIIDTVNFSVNNNPKVGNGETKDSVIKVIEEKIEEYDNTRGNDIDELTAVVEEIADKLVDENKAIKNRLDSLESGYSNCDVESAISNTNKVVKVLENQLNDDLEKNKSKIGELKELEEYNLERIEELEGQINQLLQRIEEVNKIDLSDQIVILEKKQQGEKLEITEEISKIKDQFNGLKDKIYSEDEISALIEQKMVGAEDLTQCVELIQDMQELQEEQQTNSQKMQDEIQNQNEKIETLIALVENQDKVMDSKIEEFALNNEKIDPEELRKKISEDIGDDYNEIIDAIVDRLNVVEKSQLSHEKKIANNEVKQDEYNDKFDQIMKKQEEITEKQNQVDEIRNQIEEKQALYEEGQSQIGEKQAELEAKYVELETKQAELETKQDDVEEKYAGFEAKQTEFGEQQSLFSEQQAAVEDKIDQFEEKINELSEKLEELDNIEEKTNNVLEKQQGLGVSLNFLNKNLEDYNAKNDENTEKVQEQIQEIIKQNETYTGAIEELKTSGTENAQKIDGLNEKVTALEKNGTKIQESIGSKFENVNEKITKLYKGEKAKILEQNAKIEDTNAKIADTNVKIDEINSKVAQLESYKNEQTPTAQIIGQVEELQNKLNTQADTNKAQMGQVVEKLKEMHLKLKDISKLEAKIAKNEENEKAHKTELSSKIQEIQKLVTSINDKKLTDMTIKQEDTTRKVKNLAIAMEERLEVYEQNLKTSVGEEIANTGIKNSIEEIKQKVLAQNGNIELANNKAQEYTDKRFKEAAKRADIIQGQINNIDVLVKKAAEQAYTQLKGDNDAVIDSKFQTMQNNSNKVFTKQLNQIKTQNQAIINEQVKDVRTQVGVLMSKEIEKLKAENKKVINEKLARMQVQYEAEIEKNIRKIQAEYDKKLAVIQQALNSYIKESGKTTTNSTTSRKRTTSNVATPVFSFDAIDEDVVGYNKKLYKTMSTNKVKHAAENFNDGYEDVDTDIINFFDVDDE